MCQAPSCCTFQSLSSLQVTVSLWLWFLLPISLSQEYFIKPHSCKHYLMTPSIVSLGPSPTSLHPAAYFPLGSRWDFKLICPKQNSWFSHPPFFQSFPFLWPAPPSNHCQESPSNLLFPPRSTSCPSVNHACSAFPSSSKIVSQNLHLRPPASDFPLVLLQQPPNGSCLCTAARVIFKDTY